MLCGRRSTALWPSLEKAASLLTSATHPARRRTPVQYLYMSIIEGIGLMAAIDPNRLRIDRKMTSRVTSSAQSTPPRPKAGSMFLRGPIPLDWLSRAAALPGRSLHVAIAIWFLAGLKKTRSVPVSNITGLQFGLDRNAKYRALEWLQDANLISVQRQAGRAPIVTILEPPSEK